MNEVNKFVAKSNLNNRNYERSRDPSGRGTFQRVEQQAKKEVTLTETELKTYGNRAPRGY